MLTIAPSILAADFLNLESELKSFDGVDQLWFHLDVMDGNFVPNITFGEPVLKNIKNITTHKLDAHFMVINPEDYISQFKNVGLHNFTFHWEAVTHHDRMIAEVKKHYPSVGISLNPSTPVEVIPNYLFKEIDLILIMTVNPGFGGQSFIDGCVEKVKTLKKIKADMGLNFEIQIDGGVNNANAKMLADNGATNLVAGSYIFKEKNTNYKKQVESLRE